MSKIFIASLTVLFSWLPLTQLPAQIFAPDSLAIEGYDSVAYFSEEEALEGSREFNYRWSGAEWRFISAENRDRFIEAPEDFAPAYGGWCAWAMAKGDYARSDPRQWTIHDGRLFLNYSSFIKLRWLVSKESMIEAGDGYWREINSN